MRKVDAIAAEPNQWAVSHDIRQLLHYNLSHLNACAQRSCEFRQSGHDIPGYFSNDTWMNPQTQLLPAASPPMPTGAPVRYDVSLLTDHDIYLFNEGTHYRLYDKLGAHL